MAYRSRRKAVPKARFTGFGSPSSTGLAMLSAVIHSSRSTRPAKKSCWFGNPGIVVGAQDAVGAGRARHVQAGAEGGVEGPVDVVVEIVVAELGAQLVAPPRDQSPHAAGRGIVGHQALDVGQEAERVDVVPAARAAGVPAVGLPTPLRWL